MNQRQRVFLDEMGIGPLWRRRDAAPAALDGTPDHAASMAGTAAAADPAAISSLMAPASAADPAVRAPAAPVAPVAPVMPAAPVAAAARASAWSDQADAVPVPPAAPMAAPAIAAMGWDELEAAVSRCTRCALSAGRQQAVLGRGARQAAWLAVAAAPGADDEAAGRAVAGAAGRLLDNMLLAAGQSAERNAYVTGLVKCRPRGGDGGARAATPDEVAACRPYLERELALTGGATVLALGQQALKGLLGDALEGPPVRGSVHRLGKAAVVATFHPDDLLANGEHKARAWADLCLARNAHGDPA